MVDYNTGDLNATDGFFDAAVVGDEGGQVWTVHFLEPGRLAAPVNGVSLVDNWVFARAFEPDKSSDPRTHPPIYTMASTSVQPNNQTLRAFVGTGDRAHLTSRGGGDCRPDDPTSCVAAGCTVSSTMTIDNGPNRYTSTYASAGTTSSTNPAFAAPTQSLSPSNSLTCGVTASETLHVAGCPAAFPADQTLTSSCSGSPLSCTDTFSVNSPLPDVNRGLASTATSTQQNFFMGLSILTSSFGAPGNPRKLDSAADVSTYDSTRILLADLTDVTGLGATTSGLTGTATPAGRDGPGWALKFGTVDEKTVTGAALVNSCVVWNSLTPSPSKPCGLGVSTATTFQADAFTGAPNCSQSFLGTDNVTYVRSVSRDVLSPPPEAAATISVSNDGKSVRYSMIQIQPASGGSSEVNRVDFGTSTDLLKLVNSVPLTPDQHACRHGTDKTKCP
jgi:type IV pilus assembly protein PilY1